MHTHLKDKIIDIIHSEILTRTFKKKLLPHILQGSRSSERGEDSVDKTQRINSNRSDKIEKNTNTKMIKMNSLVYLGLLFS